MDHHATGHPASSGRFDRRNVVVGALVTMILVILLGAGPMALIVATPRAEGVNIGAGMLATLSVLLAVASGSGFAARRAVRRNGHPIEEGVAGSMVGLIVVSLAFGILLAIFTPLPLEAAQGSLEVVLPGLGAAFVGAAVGSEPTGPIDYVPMPPRRPSSG